MEKPATILIAEFRQNLVNTIENSNLPLWKIKDELEFFILPQVRNAAVKEEQMELKAYNESLDKERELEELRKERVENGGNEQ